MFEVVSLDVMVYSKRKLIVKIKYVKGDTMLDVRKKKPQEMKNLLMKVFLLN